MEIRLECKYKEKDHTGLSERIFSPGLRVQLASPISPALRVQFHVRYFGALHQASSLHSGLTEIKEGRYSLEVTAFSGLHLTSVIT